MARGVKGLPPNASLRTSIYRTHKQMEEKKSSKLSSDFHMNTSHRESEKERDRDTVFLDT